MPARTHRLFGPVAVSSTVALVHTCDDDAVEILKWLAWTTRGTVQLTFSVGLGGIGNAQTWLKNAISPASSGAQLFVGFVLEPGESLYAQMTSAGGVGTVDLSGHGSKFVA